MQTKLHDNLVRFDAKKRFFRVTKEHQTTSFTSCGVDPIDQSCSRSHSHTLQIAWGSAIGPGVPEPVKW